MIHDAAPTSGVDAAAAPATGSEPRISVIIAVLNAARTLQAALDSIFEQTYPNREVIVMDGGSTDETLAILERNAARIAYWESAPDRGISHAWNKALEHVTGDWVCFLGADDRYHDPEVFQRVVERLPVGDEIERIRIVYGQLARMTPDGPVPHRGGRPWKVMRKRFSAGIMIPHPATFHHVSAFAERGGFSEDFRIAADYEWLLRELPKRKPRFVRVVVVDMAVGGLSNRPATAMRMAREVYRARYLHGRVRTPPWRSPRLYAQLGRIWVDNVRRRLRG